VKSWRAVRFLAPVLEREQLRSATNRHRQVWPPPSGRSAWRPAAAWRYRPGGCQLQRVVFRTTGEIQTRLHWEGRPDR
jgi:hypothetical protein